MHSHHILCSDFLLPKMPPPEIGPVLGANVLLFSILVGTKRALLGQLPKKTLKKPSLVSRISSIFPSFTQNTVYPLT